MKVVYNHLHFRSEDPDAAAKWYCDNFGAKITSERRVSSLHHQVHPTGTERTPLDDHFGKGRPLSTTKSIQLELNGHHLMTISGRAEGEDPVAGSTDPRYGLDHFGFETDDLEGLASQLKASGVKFNCEPWTMPSGSMVAFVVAPDEVSVELIQRPS